VKLPRQWVINVMYSYIGDPFAEFVIFRTQERNQKIYVKKDLSVAIDPDVLAAFNKSTLVSSELFFIPYFVSNFHSYPLFCLVGKSATGASLLKVGSKRKRTRREIEDEKAIKLAKE
jgi:hypothetical protein